ncbi:MAG: PilZ domain-containing protein [Candidatus Sumerlaeia bacterium]|nr:PilZ domain-containing protein [Candidatus Sumerlaeia bacterium]
MSVPSKDHVIANRRTPRYTCSFPVVLEVLMPEATFTPKPLRGTMLDVSLTGGRVLTAGLSPDLHTMLLREVRHAKIEVDLQDGRALLLKGRLVWFDRRNGESFVGMQFNPLNDKNTAELRRLLEDLAERGSILNVEIPRPM